MPLKISKVSKGRLKKKPEVTGDPALTSIELKDRVEYSFPEVGYQERRAWDYHFGAHLPIYKKKWNTKDPKAFKPVPKTKHPLSLLKSERISEKDYRDSFYHEKSPVLGNIVERLFGEISTALNPRVREYKVISQPADKIFIVKDKGKLYVEVAPGIPKEKLKDEPRVKEALNPRVKSLVPRQYKALRDTSRFFEIKDKTLLMQIGELEKMRLYETQKKKKK